MNHLVGAESYVQPTPPLEEWAERRTDRGLDWYKVFFGPEFAVEPGRILDVAAGECRLARDVYYAEDHAAEVVSVDLTLGAKPPRCHTPKTVAGSAFNLPFKDNVFDEVVSAWSLIHMPAEHATAAFGEMLRVVKPGREIMVRPMPFWRRIDRGIARRYRAPGHFLPLTLCVTKPEDYGGWPAEDRAQIAQTLGFAATMDSL